MGGFVHLSGLISEPFLKDLYVYIRHDIIKQLRILVRIIQSRALPIHFFLLDMNLTKG